MNLKHLFKQKKTNKQNKAGALKAAGHKNGTFIATDGHDIFELLQDENRQMRMRMSFRETQQQHLQQKTNQNQKMNQTHTHQTGQNHCFVSLIQTHLRFQIIFK